MGWSLGAPRTNTHTPPPCAAANMTHSPVAKRLPLPESKLAYLNETFDHDQLCSYNVRRDATNPSRSRCQCETFEPTKTTTPIEEAHHVTEPQAVEGRGRGNRNSRVVKSKTATSVEFEKNNMEFQHKYVKDCDSDSGEAEAPEGGWGYIVLLGAFIISASDQSATTRGRRAIMFLRDIKTCTSVLMFSITKFFSVLGHESTGNLSKTN